MRQWLTLGLGFGLGLAFADPASAQIKLGVAGPITGGSAAFGAQLKNGVEQAVADINAAGGILGQQIVVSTGDDRADPKEGRDRSLQLRRDDPGFRGLPGERHSGDLALRNQSEGHRPKSVEHVSHLRP